MTAIHSTAVFLEKLLSDVKWDGNRGGTNDLIGNY